MFEKGQFIIYGNTGVCIVDGVGPLEPSSGMGDRIYYTLSPFYSKESRIYTPVDNQKIVMRPILTQKEAENLIKEIPQIQELWIIDEKNREKDYKDALAKADCHEMVRVIKTIYPRKQKRLEAGKKVTASDERYFNMAEDFLYKELAISLDMDVDKVEGYIRDSVLAAESDR
ncbi:MAG: CarD family transcriptional regulator [Lachnospiraceae bacterium]|nr:CarD family transcriptional regulator [Lachnospiraceae bacterium]